ncbi:hypothetical protein IIA79_01095 [bacterium]|nr:hypothetical protein [bacterium]
MTVNKEAQPQYDYEPYLAALPRLERRAKLNQRVWRIAWNIIAAAALIAYLFIWQLEPTWLIHVFVALFIIMQLIPQRALDGSKRLSQEFEKQLEHSGLADRIAYGELNDDPIFKHTPAYMRWLVRRNPSSDPLTTLQRVASSLEWYLGPPRRHFRRSWEMAAGFSGFPILFLVFALTDMSGFIEILLFSMILFIPGMYGGILGEQRTRATVLAGFLREQWTARTAEPAPMESIGVDSAGRSAAPASPSERIERGAMMHLVLNQVEQDIVPTARNWAYLPMSLPMVVLTFLLLDFPGIGFVPVFAIAFVLMLLPVVSEKLLLKQYRNRIREELAASAVAERIASGELIHDEIYSHAQWPLAFMLHFPQAPKAYADGLRKVIWRVGFNLDWYLHPRRKLLRMSWIALPVLILLASTLFVSSMMYMPGSSYNPPLMEVLVVAIRQRPLLGVFLFALWIPLLVPIIIDGARRQIWVDELIRHLRERLAE